MKPLDQILGEQSGAIDSLISAFQQRLAEMLSSASVALSLDLITQLKTEGSDPIIASTARNRSILRNIDSKFQDALQAEGYDQLVDEFTASFNGQFTYFNEVLANIAGQLPHELPAVKFSKGDLAQFELQQLSAADLIKSVVEKTAVRARQQAIQSMGAAPVKELTQSLTQTLGTSLGESGAIAETSISTFYRTITDRGYEIIEADLPGFDIRYNYEGPLDKLTRPFCTKLEKQARGGKTWTRAQIDKMDNGQLPDVMRTCGGYRCRHQWVISADKLKADMNEKGAPKKENKATSREQVSKDINSRAALHRIKTTGTLPDKPSTEHIKGIRDEVAAKIEARRKQK